MRKLFALLLAMPLLTGFSSKNTVKTPVFECKSPIISNIYRSSESDQFIDYWENDFRLNNPSVCDISYNAYQEMYGKYSSLSKTDREIVNEIPDQREPDYTIGEIVKYLVTRYYPNTQKVKAEKKKLDQSTIIIIATVVALVGATAISVLYMLKNQKVIK